MANFGTKWLEAFAWNKIHAEVDNEDFYETQLGSCNNTWTREYY